MLRFYTYFSLLFILALAPQTTLAKNQLHNHHSPYLAMHGNDPVNWMVWGEAALEKARRENKLIFISIGYYACHWCHVMHRESYSNAGIAKHLNENFISIKIDRELNPVLDKRLINFVQVTTGSAGWPLNVFITPEGYPLVGATYIPKPQFAIALSRIQKQWQDNDKQMKTDAKEMNIKLSASILKSDHVGIKKRLSENSDAFIKQAMRQANTLQGGFSHVRQFPSASQLLVLLRLNRTEKNKSVDEFIQLTLNNMQSKGLHDEIAGGFYRYTTDPDWYTPHFEKMLYTNALLPILYQEASEQYKNTNYQQTALETMQFLLADMQGEDGAFIASLSAVDNKNIEGGYYLWQQDELKIFLSKDELTLVNMAWGLDQQSNLTAGILPMMQMSLADLSKKSKISSNKLPQQLNTLKIKLNKQRKKHRIIPKDNKLLAGWNGLTLAAFAKMVKIDPSLKISGEKLSDFLQSLWNGKQLKQAKNSKKSGNLNDYAAVAWGLIQWGNTIEDDKSIRIAEDIINTAWQKFYSEKGWLESEISLLPNPLYRQHIEDSPIPSSESLLIEATLLLEDLTWTQQINEILKKSTEDIEKSPFSYAYLIAVSKK